MGKIVDAVKRTSAAAATGSALYQLAVTVEGKPIRAKLEPASVRIFGIPIFERTETLERYWFGVIPRGRSAAAKRAIERGGPGK
jgi:putative effector of murein hydrolase